MSPSPQDFQTGRALHQAGKLVEARLCYEAILRREPDNTPARHGLALVCYDLGVAFQGRRQLAEAESAYRYAESLAPPFAELQNNLGAVLQAQDRLDEAVVAYEAALRIKPDFFQAHNNLGNALTAQNKPLPAAAAYHRALTLRPDSAEIKYNEALAYLLAGDLRRGWKNYDCRWDRKTSRGRRPFVQALWTGEAELRGRTILINAEQGLGDTLQFVRYLPLLAEQGAKVYLEVQPALKELLSRQPGVKATYARGEPLPETDLHCPLLSLPGAFSTGLDSIPAEMPYLIAPPEKVAKWRALLAAKPGRKVGLVWSGSAGHRNDRNRSIPFAAFSHILRDRSGSFFSLQKDIREADASALAERPEVTDLAPQLHDFTDTAAIIANLDLVITVDTSIVHLAGGLGIRTWVLLPFAPDWRWLLDRKDSPWYPSLRLFRQPRPGDWNSVLDDVQFGLRGPNGVNWGSASIYAVCPPSRTTARAQPKRKWPARSNASVSATRRFLSSWRKKTPISTSRDEGHHWCRSLRQQRGSIWRIRAYFFGSSLKKPS